MKIILIAATCLILLSAGVNAFTISNPNYQISGIIASGGVWENDATHPISGEIYNMYLTIGQPFTTGADKILEYRYQIDEYKESGTLQTESGHRLCLGIYCGDVFQTYYSINVSGIIKYDYGDPVANSEASLIVRYGGARYVKKITTGPNGEFMASVKVPEFIASHKLNPGGFIIQVYAKGRVEAAYTCNYEYKYDENEIGRGICS